LTDDELEQFLVEEAVMARWEQEREQEREREEALERGRAEARDRIERFRAEQGLG